MIYTSYFANYRQYPKDLTPLQISNYAPLNTAYKKFEPLVPDWWLVADYKKDRDEEKFTKSYLEQLEKLDPKEIGAKLQNYILLCFEKKGSFCHRCLVRDWLQKNGINCEEL